MTTIIGNRRFLSKLDESAVYPGDWTLSSANNANIVLTNAKGGQETFLDMMSAYGAVNFGHLNPKIDPYRHIQADLAAVFYPQEAERFAMWLCSKLELQDHRLLFQIGGSFAVSSALALATRRRPGKVAAIAGAFHGLGLDSLTATEAQKSGALHNTDWLGPLANNVLFLQHQELPLSWQGISCLIFECVQGANGYLPLDEDWLTTLVRSAQNAGVTVISDEIQCGYFRHGTLSPSRAMGLNPDILLFSKSMTNGLYPFSSVVYDQMLEKYYPYKTALAHTFQTSAMGCYAAHAVADYIDKSFPVENIKFIEEKLAEVKQRLLNLRHISEIHVTGPTLSFSLPDQDAAKYVQTCFEERLLCFTGGIKRDRVRIAPVLTITKAQLSSATEIIIGVAEDYERKNLGRMV